ncbi:AraC family transcriptional regulator [Brenneria populi subsp. brevivirga]|uniref:AraC family transcriptional regulator n=1 Tax=Brenneria populi TaxID=1505588 RepID=UPI002E18F60F|nr:AraC family transcriptional regulator [Brenneria populi subsp. brevivirga]
MLPAMKQVVEQRVAAHRGNGFVSTAIDELYLTVARECVPLYHQLYRPAICVTLQGAKKARVAGQTLSYGPMQALAARIELPAIGSVVEASPEQPYYGIMLTLDLDILREVATSIEPTASDGKPELGLFVFDVGSELEDALTRLLRLLSTPAAIPVLSPGIMREICYWLLSGPKGAAFAELGLAGTRSRGIVDAIARLRFGFAETFAIEELAAVAGMGISSFHSHFKSLTGVTPLQYQKQLRLFEARRLMLDEGINVSSTAYKVGYESVSQFGREYARFFGAPPKQDVMSLLKNPSSYVLDRCRPTAGGSSAASVNPSREIQSAWLRKRS